jgi:hypothetical protein
VCCPINNDALPAAPPKSSKTVGALAFNHGALTHYGGILHLNDFTQVLQLRRFLSRHPTVDLENTAWISQINRLKQLEKRTEAVTMKIDRLLQTFWAQMPHFSRM